MSSSSFAQAARARKVAALVEYFDGILCARGHNPHDVQGAELMAQLLRGLSPEDWARHAVSCGQRPPKTSVAEVIATYERRAESAANDEEIFGRFGYQARVSP